ncbi:pilus assembly protein HicB [Parabacteroides sp. PF5-9]|uniref:type II toxin-antitoxin system HicB family antitoxin n=1 Tax=Parabacteroides sp. PF5-9 TaxID=1742404 RepID=UPI002476EF05|nr:pilus assembly protein HicB [Parabacteroides sp. PF5-9]MDH6356963.1 putative RNase H-like HicB family nuclease [Parabacteroides sp. PF5-9]
MKVVFVIEKASDGFYSCYTDQEFEGFGLFGYGDSVEEAKADLQKAYDEIKEMNAEDGKETPVIEFEWKYDLQSFFNYFTILNVSELARKTGINPSLLRRYKNGLAQASEKQYGKIMASVHAIGNELAAAKF